MDKETAKRIVSIQERAMADAAYRQLLEEYAVSKAWFGAFLETLTEEQHISQRDDGNIAARPHQNILHGDPPFSIKLHE